MTAQIGDIYKVKNKQFTVVAMSAPMVFDPHDYGLEPQSRCTACWRGYWCEYNIEDDKLFLQNLYMYNRDENYPDINGVSVSPKTYHDAICIREKKEEIIKIEDHMGHRLYCNVNLPVSYTGRVLVGDEFIKKYYIHMGFQRSWAYKVLKEFVFEEGLLLEIIDHSMMASKIRKIIDDSDEDLYHKLGSDVFKFVEDSFSLEYSTKAWWIR